VDEVDEEEVDEEEVEEVVEETLNIIITDISNNLV